MTTWHDYLAIGLVVGALALGVGVAFAAYQVAPAGGPAAGGPGAQVTATVPPLGRVEIGERERGRVTFRMACQECHTQGRQSFSPSARERLALVQTRIREGIGQMPAFPPSRLSDDDLRDLLAYLGSPVEPEPTPTPQPPVRGLRFEVVEATVRPGAAPAVRFRVVDNAGVAMAPSDMTVLAVTVAGPTTGYQWALREDARRAESLPDGSARYEFRGRVPPDAQGTAGVVLEGSMQHVLPDATRVTDVGDNAVAYVAITDPAPVPPRIVVRTQTCNQCHGTLATHGGTRRNTEFCVMCHTATQTDAEKRATAGGPPPPESVQFANLIHRIHTGEDLYHQPFVVYGGPPANPQPIDLSAVHPFPGDRANCTTCHEPGTYALSGALERAAPLTVTVEGQIIRQVPPVTAACTGCHDSPRAMAHATNMTTALGVETCATCHGTGRPFAVEAVHRIADERARPAVPTPVGR